MTRSAIKPQIAPFAVALVLAVAIVGVVAQRSAPAGGGDPSLNWETDNYDFFFNFTGIMAGNNVNGGTQNWVNSDNDNFSPTVEGWYADYAVNNDPITLTASAGGNGADTLLALGNGGESGRALGAEPGATSGDIAWGVRFTNNTGHVIRALKLALDGQEWAGSMDGDHTTQFFYRVGGTTFALASDQTDWTAATEGDVTFNLSTNGPIGPNVDAVAFTLGDLWIEPGDDFWFGWLDVDDIGLDHQVGIDDVQIAIVSALVDDFDDYVDGLEITNSDANANPDTDWYEAFGNNSPIVIDGEVMLGNDNAANGIAARQLTGAFDSAYGDNQAEPDVYSGFVLRFSGAPAANSNLRIMQMEDAGTVMSILWAVNNSGQVQLGTSLPDCSGGPDNLFNMNLAANTNYSVILGTEFNGCATASRVWINPVNINSNNSTSNTDFPPSNDLTTVHLVQQNNDTATFFIDDLTVATDFDVANPPLADFSAANDAATTAAPGSTVVVAEFEVDAGAHVSSTLREVTLTATGDLDDANDVDSVELWLDRDGSGDFDETLDAPVLDSDDFSADDGSVTLSLDATIAADDSATFFVVYDLASDATTDVDFSVDVSGAELFGRAAGLPVSGRTISVEPGTLTFSVSAGNSGFGKTDGSQTADILAVTVSADGNSATISSIDLAYAAASNVSGIDIVHDGTTIASASAIAAGTTETLNFSPDVTVADGADESFVVRVTITGEGAELRASITGAGVSAGVTVSGLPSGEGVITIDNGGSAFGLLLIVPLLGLIALVVIRRR